MIEVHAQATQKDEKHTKIEKAKSLAGSDYKL
jgi:hypothetical protein